MVMHEMFQCLQNRAREEILRVVGRDRLTSMADKHLLPFTSALVHEVQRRANILQVNVNRRTTEDVEIMVSTFSSASVSLSDEVFLRDIFACRLKFKNPIDHCSTDCFQYKHLFPGSSHSCRHDCRRRRLPNIGARSYL